MLFRSHGYLFLEAEVAYCARHEYCASAIDFLARRSRLAFLDTDAAGRALPRVIKILADEHRWDKARQKLELQKAKEFLETFKSSKNAQFHDGKHTGMHYCILLFLFFVLLSSVPHGVRSFLLVGS